LRHEPSEGSEKLIWVIVIALTTFIGAVLYLVMRRPARIRQHGK